MKIKLLATLMLVFILYANPVYAQSEEPFSTKYDITYDIEDSGRTNVSQLITISNRQKDVVATNYTLSIRKMRIFDIGAASTDNKDLEFTPQETNETTEIKVEFTDPTLGIDRSNSFSIDYKTFDIAYKIGEIWNINIPKVNLLETTAEYNVTLIVPKSFGPKIFISPEIKSETEDKNHYIYAFAIDQVRNSGITAAFGKFQVLNFKLDYTLKNDTHFSNKETIALPPDIQGIQQISYKNITPKPDKLSWDTDGNVLAHYLLEPNSDKKISVTGAAKILGKQINPTFGGMFSQLPNDLKDKYTKAQPYWDVSSPQIQQIAQELVNPTDSVTQNAQRAYLYVTSKLTYDFNTLNKDSVTRNGALGALMADAKTSCMDFTDLFIAITRAMGIPARELNGYAITNDVSGANPLSINLKGGDLLHAWAEFYDPEFGWVPVDPTWGATSGTDYFTKLDTNHLVFVRKGLDPTKPLPAGAYKLSENEKQVQVDFVHDIIERDFLPQLTLHLATDFNVFNQFQNRNKYHIKNTGQTIAYIDANDSQITLLPDEYKEIYLSHAEEQLRVSDASGQVNLIKPALSNTPLENIKKTFATASLLVLFLCVTNYYLIFRLQVLNKLFRHLRRRPPVPNQ